MNRLRMGLAVASICAAATWLVWTRNPTSPNDHRQMRQLVLHYTLARTDAPIIVIGDSIVEASTLPQSVCGHPIVNAGLSGASTASDLGSWLATAFSGRQQAALIVLSLGINDALASTPKSKQDFGDRYGALLTALSKMTSHLATLEISPVEPQGRMTPGLRDDAMKTINDYNSLLPDLAKRNGAAFVALPAMPMHHTLDGIHLNADGYAAWDKAVMQAAAMICS